MSVLQAAEASSHSGSNNHNYTHKTTEPGIKLPSSQYKGVIPQPNGRWGAQIYERHHRVWLGTFNNEEEAGKAYDRAARKFRGASAITNFLPLRDADPESAFLHTHSKEQIVDMLRRHTYDKELQLKACKLPVIAATTAPGNPHVVTMSMSALHTSTMAEEVLVASRRRSVAQEHLFDKALTPSDVGKLNRLVIPKQHAECCFPLDSESSDKGLLLSFEDPGGKIWRFRYSYWNSSQSYVLTKGWSRFVKEKKLEAGDIITFERDAGNNRELYISWHPHPSIPHPPLLSTPCLHFGFPLLPPSLWLNRNYRTPAAGRLQLLPPALRFLANSSDANNNSGRDKRLVQGVQSLWSSAALEQQHRIIAREVSERVVAASTVAFPAPTCSTVTENSNQTSNHDAVLQWSAKDETFECLAGRCKDATDISSSSSQKSKKHNDNNNSNDTMPTPILRLFGVNLSPPLQSSSWDNQPMCPHKRTAAAEEVPSLNSLKRRPCGDGDCDLSS